MRRLGRLFLVSSLVGCAPHTPLPPDPDPADTTADTAILTLILAKWDLPGFDSLFIADTRLKPDPGDYPVGGRSLATASIPGEHQGDQSFEEAWRDYQRFPRPGRDLALRSIQAGLTRPIRAVHQAPAAQRQSEPWIWFGFSPIGFSHDSTAAVVYAEYYCGLLCAGGDTYLLRRSEAGIWRIAHQYQHWRS